MTVSIWWALGLFLLGGMVGMLAMALLAAAGDEEDYRTYSHLGDRPGFFDEDEVNTIATLAYREGRDSRP